MALPSFDQHTILIIGATSGLGCYLAHYFAKLGANLMLCARSDEKLRSLKDKLKSFASHINAELIDISNEAMVADSFKQIDIWLKQLNATLNLAINCVGIVKNGAIDAMSNTDFKQMIDTNLYGIWLCMKEEIRLMKLHKKGTIINISSNIGLHATRPSMAGYGATKAALTILGRTAALELLPYNLAIHTLSPGPFDTNLSYRLGETKEMRDVRIFNSNPSKRVGTLAEMAETIDWLYRSPQYLVGQDIIIDGGASL